MLKKPRDSELSETKRDKSGRKGGIVGGGRSK